MGWRLGLDLGAGSLGWCALTLDEAGKPVGILASGSRIFGDGRTPSRGDQQGTPLAAERRAARAARRRRDRFKRRQTALLKYLTADGLFPADQQAREELRGLDPYALRAHALDGTLPLHHIGRAFFHLNQRRGFKSNRKADRKSGDDVGLIATGIDRLRDAIEESGARTFGEFLHMRRSGAPEANSIPSVRTRLRPEPGENAKGNGYDFYPGRALLEEEFNAIWDAQAAFHPRVLTEQVRKRLFEIVFHQRPLKKPKVGTCTLIPGEERLPKAHPLFQKRRLLEELNALMIVRPGEKAETLTKEQRDLLFLKLKDKRKVTFSSLRKTLKLDADARFNKESESRKELAGDEVAAELGAKSRFTNRWAHMQWQIQWSIVDRVLDEEDDHTLRQWLIETNKLTEDQASAVAAARLPHGYGRFGQTATIKLIEALEADVIVYSDAVIKAGLGHHSDFRTGELHDELPYYGVVLERHIMPGTADPSDPEELRVGRLTNPTVHIGLNQLRGIVNDLIRFHGRPAEIAVELARELKLTEDQKKRLSRENNKNRIAAEERSKKLAEINQADSGANRVRLKLWEELNPENVLDRRCIYTGQQISIEMLFGAAVEIDHILPFDATLDDSNANKILCMREANRAKRKQSPFEAWGHTDKWEEIAARAARLPKTKRWRFEPDAMERFSDENEFLARHLIDTQYLSRLAREYLAALYAEKGEGSVKVSVSPGRLTEIIRRKLGLNELLPDHNFGGSTGQRKNRLDHRHHAIDAAVVAITDRSLLNAMSRASAQGGAEGRERVIVPEPWPNFRDDLRQSINAIVVSYRPDHGTATKAGLPKGRDQTAGKLHNDTAYGLTSETDANGNTIVVHRVPLGSLKPTDLLPDGAPGVKDKRRVRDEDLREALWMFTKGKDGKAFAAALGKFPQLGALQFRNIRRVRVKEPLSVIGVHDDTRRPYKGYKGDSNYRYDVWELPNGEWRPDVVSMFDANQQGWTSKVRTENPTARKVLSLHQGDIVAVEREAGERRLMRVVKFGQNGQITLAEPQEAGDLKRRDAMPIDQDPFKYVAPTAGGLLKMKARQVRVDTIGRVFDPGFPARTARRRTRKKLG